MSILALGTIILTALSNISYESESDIWYVFPEDSLNKLNEEAGATIGRGFSIVKNLKSLNLNFW